MLGSRRAAAWPTASWSASMTQMAATTVRRCGHSAPVRGSGGPFVRCSGSGAGCPGFERVRSLPSPAPMDAHWVGWLASCGRPALALLLSCRAPRTIGDYVCDRERDGRHHEQSFPSSANPNLRFFHLIWVPQKQVGSVW